MSVSIATMGMYNTQFTCGESDSFGGGYGIDIERRKPQVIVSLFKQEEIEKIEFKINSIEEENI